MSMEDKLSPRTHEIYAKLSKSGQVRMANYVT